MQCIQTVSVRFFADYLIPRMVFIHMLFEVFDILKLFCAMYTDSVSMFLRMITSPDDIQKYVLTRDHLLPSK